MEKSKCGKAWGRKSFSMLLNDKLVSCEEQKRNTKRNFIRHAVSVCFPDSDKRRTKNNVRLR